MRNSTLVNQISEDLREGILQYNRKNHDEARDLFYSVLDKDPSNPEANYYLGLMYAREDNQQKAVLHLKAVVDLGANFLFTQQCRMILGLIYFKNKEYRRAEYEYQEVLKANVKIVQVYTALAVIKYSLGEKKEALTLAAKACDIDSYNLNAKNTYAYLLCDLEIDVKKSVEILKEVVRIKSDNPLYLDSLGWAYYKSKNKKAAVANLRKALKYSEGNFEIQKHLDIVTSAGAL